MKMLNTFVVSKELKKYIDDNCGEKGEVETMCRAITELIEDGRIENSWTKYIGTTSYNSWSGLAFEMVCLNHVQQIKAALGITGVDSTEYAWRSLKSTPGAQIDLVIDRMDNVVNLSEIKYTTGEYTIDDSYAANLRNKIEVFRKETKTKKAVYLTFISVNGLASTGRSSVIVNEVTGEDLFG